MMKRLLLCLLLPILPLLAKGKEGLAYLYIQGDKQTPFYVKLEDAMQPRYGKNYCIIPQLAPGPAHIEILFQQNAFPPQQFTVMIPDGGSRGFLLVKETEGFSLYDLRQGFYLRAGNKEEDDRQPTGSAVIAGIQPPPIVDTVLRVRAQNNSVGKPFKPRKGKLPEVPKTTASTSLPEEKEGPAFIPNLELPKTDKPGQESNTPKTVTQTESVPVIANSDCPKAISTEDFGKIFNAMSAVSGDEDRLGYIIGRMDVCYESWQARALAQMLSTESARYTLLKKTYPHITDQGAFPLLDDLFSNEIWKAEFARLVRH